MFVNPVFQHGELIEGNAKKFRDPKEVVRGPVEEFVFDSSFSDAFKNSHGILLGQFWFDRRVGKGGFRYLQARIMGENDQEPKKIVIIEREQ